MSRLRHTVEEDVPERGKMPNPPPRWFPLSNMVEGNNLAPKKGRGPTVMRQSWGKDEGKLKIEVNELKQPIPSNLLETGPLGSNLGVLARDGSLLPLNYKSWRWVPEHGKKMVWGEIKEHTDATDSMEYWFMQSVGKKWAGWKGEAKRIGYSPYTTDAERIANRPNRVTAEQWRFLVHYWGIPEVQVQSQKNKETRAGQKLLHTSGRTPHHVLREKEKKRINAVPSRIDMFVQTYTRRNGKPVNETTDALIGRLVNLRPSRKGRENDTFYISQATEEDAAIFTEVVGVERAGRVRGYGLGATPTQVFKGQNIQSSQSSQTHVSSQCSYNFSQKDHADLVEDHKKLVKDQAKLVKQMNRMEQAWITMGMSLPEIDDDSDDEKVPLDACSAPREKTPSSHHSSWAAPNQLEQGISKEQPDNYIAGTFVHTLDDEDVEFDKLLDSYKKIPSKKQGKNKQCGPTQQHKQTLDLQRDVQIEPLRKKKKHMKSGSIQHQQKTLDPQQNLCGKVNKHVDLLSPGLPKQIVARGVLVDRDPKKVVAGVPLGTNYVEVNITEALNPSEFLVRPGNTNCETVGDALELGENVAWWTIDVKMN